jgi:hypothetical protein
MSVTFNDNYTRVDLRDADTTTLSLEEVKDENDEPYVRASHTQETWLSEDTLGPSTETDYFDFSGFNQVDMGTSALTWENLTFKSEDEVDLSGTEINQRGGTLNIDVDSDVHHSYQTSLLEGGSTTADISGSVDSAIQRADRASIVVGTGEQDSNGYYDYATITQSAFNAGATLQVRDRLDTDLNLTQDAHDSHLAVHSLNGNDVVTVKNTSPGSTGYGGNELEYFLGGPGWGNTPGTLGATVNLNASNNFGRIILTKADDLVNFNTAQGNGAQDLLIDGVSGNDTIRVNFNKGEGVRFTSEWDSAAGRNRFFLADADGNRSEINRFNTVQFNDKVMVFDSQRQQFHEQGTVWDTKNKKYVPG